MNDPPPSPSLYLLHSGKIRASLGGNSDWSNRLCHNHLRCHANCATGPVRPRPRVALTTPRITKSHTQMKGRPTPRKYRKDHRLATQVEWCYDCQISPDGSHVNEDLDVFRSRAVQRPRHDSQVSSGSPRRLEPSVQDSGLDRCHTIEESRVPDPPPFLSFSMKDTSTS